MAAKSLAATLALAACVLLAPRAAAKSVHDSPYTYEQTFGTALRLVKVDLELEVTESNAEWGYLLFVYTHPESGQRKNRGSFSFVKGDKGIQVSLQVPEMPSYHEQFIMDRLKRKLGEEHGDPPKPVKPPKEPPREGDEGGKKEPSPPAEPPAEGPENRSEPRRRSEKR